MIRKVSLGFGPDDIRMHLIRSGGVMVMSLSRAAFIIIQRVGHQDSLTFLEYTYEQVEIFTYEVSQKMILFEKFYNLNEKEYKTLNNL